MAERPKSREKHITGEGKPIKKTKIEKPDFTTLNEVIQRLKKERDKQ